MQHRLVNNSAIGKLCSDCEHGQYLDNPQNHAVYFS